MRQDIISLVFIVPTRVQEHQISHIVQHAALQPNVLLVQQDIMSLVLVFTVLTLVLEPLISYIVQHAVPPLNALLVKQDIMSQVCTVLILVLQDRILAIVQLVAL